MTSPTNPPQKINLEDYVRHLREVAAEFRQLPKWQQGEVGLSSSANVIVAPPQTSK
jgi:hypothetical protein